MIIYATPKQIEVNVLNEDFIHLPSRKKSACIKKHKTFQSKDIQAAVKISRIQLIHWTECGVIIPYDNARGRGRVRIYDDQNLVEAVLCKELNKYAVTVHSMREILEYLRNVKIEFLFRSLKEAGDKPITKKLTLWNFFKLYSHLAHNLHFVFVIASYPNLNNKKISSDDLYVDLRSFEDVTDVVKHMSSAIVINMFKIIEQAEVY